MDEFVFDQLMNIEVPEKCIEKALNVPAEYKKRVLPVRYYRYAAAAAVFVAVAAAVILSLVMNKGNDAVMINPGNGLPINNEVITDTNPGATDGATLPSGENALVPGGEFKTSTAVTEPAEGSAASKAESSKPGNQSVTNQNTPNSGGNNANNSNASSNAGDNNAPENTDTPEEPQNGNNTEATTYDFFNHQPGQFGAGGGGGPRPTETEAYGCHFVTSVDRSAAQGNTYYCRIEDGSGNTLGSGTAQKYDWGNPKWPLDLKYTADFVMYYGETYTVTFYGSNGATVWSGAVYLKEHQTDYLLY